MFHYDIFVQKLLFKSLKATARRCNLQKLPDTEYNLKTSNQRIYGCSVRKTIQPVQFITRYWDKTNTQLSISNVRAAGPGNTVQTFLKRLKLEFIPGKNNDSNIDSSPWNYASLVKILKK